MLGTAGMTATKTRRRAPEKLSAAPKVEIAKVVHPRLAGCIEIVQRVVDTLDAMRKRRHLSEREYQAADHYRTCWDTVHGSVGGVMDFDRPRGGALPGQPPAPRYLLASEVCSEARRYLYPQDYAVVHRVCALGMSVEETAMHLYQINPTRPQKEDCGRRLREGLAQMADRWFPEHRGRGNRMRSHVEERATATDAATVSSSSVVVHATRDKIFRSRE